jgi:rhamnosyltransferase
MSMISAHSPVIQQPFQPKSCLVLLAVFNGMRWLPEQLQSILAQEGVRVHILVSVDESSDGSEAWIRNHAELHPNITVLPDGQRFGGAAPNFFRLIRDAFVDEFDYIAFSDQDDLWYPNKLARAIAQLQEKKADGYSSNVLAFWPNGNTKLIDKAQAQVNWDYLFEAAGPGCTYVISSALARGFQACLIEQKTEANQVGLHDWFLYAYARSHHFRWVIDPWPSLRYRQHEANQVGSNTGWTAFWMRANRVLNGWAMAQTLLIADLIGMQDHPLIKELESGSRFAYWHLLFMAPQCRRRFKDRILFILMCVLMLIRGPMHAKS